MNKNKLLMFFIINGLFNLAANYAHPITPTVIKNLQLGDYMFGVAFGAMMGLNFLFSPFWGKLNEQKYWLRSWSSFVLASKFTK